MVSVKKKRVSKKNKKSWRRNVDLKDVENFLEDQRLEERLGVKLAEQKNEDLFQIDAKGGNEENETDVPEYKQTPRVTSLSKRLRETETPKCFQILEKRTAVPPHIINKTRIRKGDGTSTVARTIIKRNLKREFLKAKNKVESAERNKEVKEPQTGVITYDIWSKENNERDLNGCSEWLSNDTIRHTLHNTGKCRRQIPKTLLSKTSLLPAIEAPHPGLSYNPSLKDHTDLLHKVAEAEMTVIEEEKHLDRVTTKMFKKISEDKRQKQWLSEMTVGLTVTKTESDEDDGTEYKAVNPPVKNRKKTLQKRRKLREAVRLKEQLRQQKIEKKKISDIYKLRKFKEILDKEEEKIAKNIEKRKQIKEMKPYTTKLLSQTKYVEPEIDFNLAEDLSGNLRGVKQEGNILYDRFKSLQKRNILQPTVKRYVKKRKVKKYEREHTKMGWEPKGYVPYEGSKETKS